MKLSTKGEYGLRVMFELALYYEKGTISLKNIAESQDLSVNYLEQIIAVLKKAELVKSIRGAQGGYILLKEPSEISVGDIVRALEGPVVQVKCINTKEKKPCSRVETCISRRVWKKIKDRINNVVDSITLSDMLEEAKEININNEE